MPKPVQKRKTGQQQADIQQFFNPVTPRIQSASRPVNAYAAPVHPSKTGEVISQATQGLSAGASSLLNILEGHQTQRGKQAALAGKEMPERASDNFIRGYETYNAKAQLSSYSKNLHDLYLKSGDMTVEEFTQARGEIEQQYLNGASEHFVRGFVPKANELATLYDKKVLEDQRNRVIHDLRQDTRKRFDGEMDLLYAKMQDGQDVNVGQAIRKVLTEVFQENKELTYLDKTVLAKEAIHMVGRRAVYEKDPNMIMDFIEAYEEPDADGFSLKHRPDLGEHAMNYYDTAIRAKEAHEKAIKKEREARQKEAVNNGTKILIDLMESRNPEALRRAEQDMDALRPFMSPTMYGQLRRRLYDIQDDAFFARSADPFIYGDLLNQALKGELNPADVYDLTTDYLDRSSVQDLLATNLRAQNEELKSVSKMKQIEDLTRYEMKMARADDPNDPYGKIFDTDNSRKRGRFIISERDRWISEMVEQEQRLPTYEETLEKLKSLRERAEQAWPPQSIDRIVGGQGQSQPTNPRDMIRNNMTTTPESIEDQDRSAVRKELEALRSNE